MNSLRRRVKALVSRVRQLAGLLRAAGITVPEAQDGGGVEEALDDEVVPPSEPNNLPPALGPRPMRWSNKIKPQEAALLLEKVQALSKFKFYLYYTIKLNLSYVEYLILLLYKSQNKSHL